MTCWVCIVKYITNPQDCAGSSLKMDGAPTADGGRKMIVAVALVQGSRWKWAVCLCHSFRRTSIFFWVCEVVLVVSHVSLTFSSFNYWRSESGGIRTHICKSPRMLKSYTMSLLSTTKKIRKRDVLSGPCHSHHLLWDTHSLIQLWVEEAEWHRLLPLACHHFIVYRLLAGGLLL